MTKDEAVEVIHERGFVFGGHSADGGPWRVSLYRLSDGMRVAEVSAPSWDEGILKLAEWVKQNGPSR